MSHYTWTLFTFGNGDIIFAVFNSLQALIKSALFIGLLNVILLIGFATLVFGSVAQGRLPILYTVKYLLFSAVFIRLLLSFTITLGLVDLANATNDKVLTGVPFILGAPASILSQIGKFLALEIDTFYNTAAQLPAELSMEKGRYNIVGTLIKDSLSHRLNDPYLKKSLTYFFVDCISPLIGNNTLTTSTFLNSPSIWNVVKSLKLNASLMTVYYGSVQSKHHSNWGEILTCHEASKNLDRDLNSAHSASNNQLQAVLNYTARHTKYTPNADHYLQQSALLHLFSDAIPDLMAMRTHSSLLMHRLIATKSGQPVKSGRMTASKTFQSSFSYLYAVLQVMVYAMTPLVIVFSILPGLRGVLLKRYLQLLAWFPVTLVLISIVSNVLTTWAGELLGNVWQTSGGLTVNSRHLVSAASYKLLDVGEWLMTITPVIAWGLVSGLSAAMNTVWQALSSPSAVTTVGDNSAQTSHPSHTVTPHPTDLAALPSPHPHPHPSPHHPPISSSQIKPRQTQPHNSLTQSFNYLSDHLGGGTKGKLLAGSLLSAGAIAAGSALAVGLPEEAALAGVAGAARAASGTIIKLIGHTLEDIEAMVGADLGDTLGGEILEGVEDLFGVAHSQKEQEH